MNKEFAFYLGAIIALFLLLLGWLFSTPEAIARFAAPDHLKTETTLVKITLEGGHGSGVHIGNGYILTAAHVVKDAKTATLKTKDGKTRQAAVLWANTEYDIALLRSQDGNMDAAALDCRIAQAGDFITSYGNPLNVEFAAAFGRIAGEPRALGPWKSVFVTDITTVMGQSGGPVFDADGRLIGITVGVMGAPMGFSHSLVGYGFVVPSRAVCDLLARGEPA
ncbi:serine protease [Sinorhizobium meliloti]|uniref:S1C family serine protease n=1 Tax=Rhizobium meliloti TaxID=382 RepID=UPI000B49C298|nr:serine protease [Sinorhizobium meliloti]ASQ10239.1 serine protease [Sinorhizobium meliloti]MQU83550.1 trypsin-like serine protease [Sinorhizobium meliloti]